MSYTTGTLTGTHRRPDGTPHAGTVTAYPLGASQVRDRDDRVVLSGSVRVALKDGAYTLELPASDDVTLDPSGVLYAVHVDLDDEPLIVYRGVPVLGGQVSDETEWELVDPITGPIYQPGGGGVGPAGPRGPEGPRGPAGRDGIDGEDGRDGYDGLNGGDGLDGEDGLPGPGVAAGGTPGQVLIKTGAAGYATGWADPPAGGVAGPSSLARTDFGPQSAGSYYLSANQSALLPIFEGPEVTFAAPASGKVAVDFAAFVGAGSPATSTAVWGLVDASGSPVAEQLVTYGLSNGQGQRLPLTVAISGLVPGQSYTWRWAWSCAYSSDPNGGGFAQRIFTGPNSIMTMEVRAL